VPGWVTIFGRVNHLGTEPGTLAWACPLWLGWNDYLAKVRGVNRHIVWYTSPYLWSHRGRWRLAGVLSCGDQCRPMGSCSTLEALCDDALYKYTFSLLYLLYTDRFCGHQRSAVRCETQSSCRQRVTQATCLLSICKLAVLQLVFVRPCPVSCVCSWVWEFVFWW